MAFLELKDCNIGYHSPLLKAVNATLNLGEVCLLMGNNGVGKTTLIKSILHQTPVLDGEILLDNRPIKKLTFQEISQKIAVVFSKAQHHNNFTVRDLISFGKYIHYPYYFELSQDDQLEVAEVIDRLQLTEYSDTPLTHISDGNLQKAFIGRALTQNSPFIILDEPTTHLDESNKIMILEVIRTLAKTQEKLILFSSHDWRLAKEFADKIWLIQNQHLSSGITEDILIKNHHLLKPKLFWSAKEFKTLEIIAPETEKEMLYSFLQKDGRKYRENMKFEYKDGFWVISTEHLQKECDNFEDILQFLQNHH